jgi:predicted molibdopterin-dependent oxidoreductase YjgC
VQWPSNLEDQHGSSRLYAKGFPKGRVRLTPVEYGDEIEADGSDYPFILLTGSAQFHSGTLSSQSSALNQVCSGSVEVNGSDARKKGLKNNDNVVVKSKHGEVRAKVKVSKKQPEGTVFIPYHFENLPVNTLTDRAMKYVRVNVERC